MAARVVGSIAAGDTAGDAAVAADAAASTRLIMDTHCSLSAGKGRSRSLAPRLARGEVRLGTVGRTSVRPTRPRPSERVRWNPDRAFHQHARTAAHDCLGDGPLAVDQFGLRTDA